MGYWYNGLGDLLPRLRGPGNRRPERWTAGLVAAWKSVFGEELAGVARPLKLDEHGVLTLTAKDGGWAQELKLMQPLILERLAAALPGEKLTALKTRVAPHLFAAPPPPGDPDAEGPALDDAEFEQAAEAAHGLRHERVRDIYLDALLRRWRRGRKRSGGAS